MAPHLDREGIPFQKYVPSFIAKFNPLAMNRPYKQP
jgi:hypothetical protein